MIVWASKSGRLFHNSRLLGTGYAGNGLGVNNPALEHVRSVGPLPTGLYTIGKPRDHARLGKLALPLLPHVDNMMWGRSGFWIHGDNAKADRSASSGCIVVDHDDRVYLSKSGDTLLVVVPV